MIDALESNSLAVQNVLSVEHRTTEYNLSCGKTVIVVNKSVLVSGGREQVERLTTHDLNRELHVLHTLKPAIHGVSENLANSSRVRLGQLQIERSRI